MVTRTSLGSRKFTVIGAEKEDWAVKGAISNTLGTTTNIGVCHARLSVSIGNTYPVGLTVAVMVKGHSMHDEDTVIPLRRPSRQSGYRCGRAVPNLDISGSSDVPLEPSIAARSTFIQNQAGDKCINPTEDLQRKPRREVQ